MQGYGLHAASAGESEEGMRPPPYMSRARIAELRILADAPGDRIACADALDEALDRIEFLDAILNEAIHAVRRVEKACYFYQDDLGKNAIPISEVRDMLNDRPRPKCACGLPDHHDGYCNSSVFPGGLTLRNKPRGQER